MEDSKTAGSTCLYDDLHKAGIAWSYIAMGMDERAHSVVSEYGYLEALKRLERGDIAVKSMAGESFETWRARLDQMKKEDAEDDRYRAMKRLGVCVIIPSDDLWPSMINDLGEKAPLALWVRGQESAVTEVLGERAKPSVAMVGSRAASSRGIRIALDMAYELAREYVVASGGAFGVDAAAHKGALASGGKTVIFSAAGVDRVYPASHADLYKQIWNGGGVVISEYTFGAAPHAHRFLQRNRLIAAFSRATIVVEAPIRSGALSTARSAMEIGRPVGAVPGMIDSPYSLGCHELIRHGGTLVASVGHIRELVEPIGSQLTFDIVGNVQCEHGVSRHKKGAASVSAAPESMRSGVAEESGDFFSPPKSALGSRGQIVLDAMSKRYAHDIAFIARESGLEVEAVRAELGKLALLGLVSNASGRWIKTPPQKIALRMGDVHAED